MRTYGYDHDVKALEIGQVMRVVAARGRMELRVFRAGGGMDVRPAGDIKAAKEEGRRLHAADPEVYRVDLRDPMRDTDIWSTDEDWPAR